MRSAGRQASNLEHGVRIGVTGQNIRSRAPWTTILAARQDVPNGGSGAAVAPHAVTFRDRVGRLRQFLIASGQIQMTASTRTRRKIERPKESGMLA